MAHRSAVHSPYYPYSDSRGALSFIVDVLGYEKVLVVPDEGDIRHSELKLGDSFIIVAQRKPGIGKAPFMNYTYLGGEDALDAYLATIKGKGANITKEKYKTPYHSWEAEVEDPEGNTWSFGTYKLGSWTG